MLSVYSCQELYSTLLKCLQSLLSEQSSLLRGASFAHARASWTLSNICFCTKLNLSRMLCVQVGQEGYMRSRARRWARVVDDATWPEVLRRYLLATRAMLPQPSEAELARDVSCIDDDEAAVMAASLLAQQSFLRCVIQRLCILSLPPGALLEGIA